MEQLPPLHECIDAPGRADVYVSAILLGWIFLGNVLGLVAPDLGPGALRHDLLGTSEFVRAALVVLAVGLSGAALPYLAWGRSIGRILAALACIILAGESAWDAVNMQPWLTEDDYQPGMEYLVLVPLVRATLLVALAAWLLRRALRVRRIEYQNRNAGAA